VWRVVLDANVFVSAYIHPEGTPGHIVERFLQLSSLELVLTDRIVDEVIAALSYPKVQKAARSTVKPELWFEDVAVLSQLVPGDVEIPRLSDDPDDDKYIAVPSRDGRRLSSRAILIHSIWVCTKAFES